ncbi:MAG: glycosyltransferase family 4 protein [Magnetococcales bacterium]|nr:glycosyltransferase family 4 protein [Magnetococcales bacterium]
MSRQNDDINLETATVSAHLAQPIDSPSISQESLITNKVTKVSTDTPDKSIDYTMHALPAAVSRLKQTRLVLFFTHGMSLHSWETSHLFEREVAIYLALLPHLGGITFITYGDKKDLQFAQKLKGIEVVCNHMGLSSKWYRRYLTWWPAKWQKGQVVFKTNQIRGSDLALDIAKHHNKPFISRCGYLLADWLKWLDGEDAKTYKSAFELENMVFNGASRVVVTTDDMKNIVTTSYNINSNKVFVTPNYVNTDLFTPEDRPKPTKRLISIGRLEKQKNIESLILALANSEVELWLVGRGTLEEKLINLARTNKVNVKFCGIQPHIELPNLLNQSTVFILPSHWEGHPKTLLEAMSCGLPVIGSNIPSIAGVIKNGDNGLLCDPTPDAIRKTVFKLLDNTQLQKKLGNNARKYVLENLTIGKTVQRELLAIREQLL